MTSEQDSNRAGIEWWRGGVDDQVFADSDMDGIGDLPASYCAVDAMIGTTKTSERMMRTGQGTRT